MLKVTIWRYTLNCLCTYLGLFTILAKWRFLYKDTVTKWTGNWGSPVSPTDFWPSVMTHAKLMQFQRHLCTEGRRVHCNYKYIMLLVGEKDKTKQLDIEWWKKQNWNILLPSLRNNLNLDQTISKHISGLDQEQNLKVSLLSNQPQNLKVLTIHIGYENKQGIVSDHKIVGVQSWQNQKETNATDTHLILEKGSGHCHGIRA